MKDNHTEITCSGGEKRSAVSRGRRVRSVMLTWALSDQNKLSVHAIGWSGDRITQGQHEQRKRHKGTGAGKARRGEMVV